MGKESLIVAEGKGEGNFLERNLFPLFFLLSGIGEDWMEAEGGGGGELALCF